MVPHICNHSSLDAEKRVLLGVLGQPALHSEFQNTLDYMWRLCLKTKTKPKHANQFYVNLTQGHKVESFGKEPQLRTPHTLDLPVDKPLVDFLD